MTLDKTKITEYLKNLNECEFIKRNGSDKEVLIFKDRDNIFKIYGERDTGVLDPFNDYTYNWLNSFLSNVIDLLNYKDFDTLEELEEEIKDNLIGEWVDSETDIYTSNLTEWLSSNNSNTYYLEEGIKEYPEHSNHLQLAQYTAIDELFNNALNIMIEDLKQEFEEDEQQ